METTVIEVTQPDRSLVGGKVYPDGSVWVNPSIAAVCDVEEFRRNLLTAAGGSSSAQTYVDDCMRRLALPKK